MSVITTGMLHLSTTQYISNLYPSISSMLFQKIVVIDFINNCAEKVIYLPSYFVKLLKTKIN